MTADPTARARIKAQFDAQFARWEIALPDDFDRDTTPRAIGKAGWTLNYRWVPSPEGGAVEYFASHRMTNDRLCRIDASGETTLGAVQEFFIVGRPGAEQAMVTHNRAFYAAVTERGLGQPVGAATALNAALRSGAVAPPPQTADAGSMSTDEIVRRAAVASAAMVIAPDLEPKEMRHVIPALASHLTGVVDDLRREVTIPVPNWLPSPGRTDIVIGQTSPYSAVIEVKVWELGWCLWDMVKVASLLESRVADNGYLIVVASEGKFAQRPGFGQMLDGDAEIVTRDLFTTYQGDWLDLLRGGSGRPVKLPGKLQTTLLSRTSLQHKAGWEIRAVKVSVPADAGWVSFVSEAWPEGHPRPASGFD